MGGVDHVARQRVRALIQRAGVAMLTNIDEHGTHVGRPMLPLLLENDDPHIYFLTHQSSRKVAQVAARPQVALTIISANCYVVVAGSAHASRDAGLILEGGYRDALALDRIGPTVVGILPAATRPATQALVAISVAVPAEAP